MKTILVISLLCCFISATAQEKQDTAYLFFDAKSEATCIADIEDLGNVDKKVRKYEKTINDHVISFYICLEMFDFNPKFHKKDTMDISYLQEVKFSKLEDMIAVIDEREKRIPFSYLSPSSAFEKIYVIEKINDKQIVRYGVTWVYYIE